MLDQALVGSLLTGGLALASQIVAKIRCYTGCKRDPEGEFCEPTCQFGFMDASLADMTAERSREALERHTESSHEETPPP